MPSRSLMFVTPIASILSCSASCIVRSLRANHLLHFGQVRRHQGHQFHPLSDLLPSHRETPTAASASPSYSSPGFAAPCTAPPQGFASMTGTALDYYANLPQPAFEQRVSPSERRQRHLDFPCRTRQPIREVHLPSNLIPHLSKSLDRP